MNQPLEALYFRTLFNQVGDGIFDHVNVTGTPEWLGYRHNSLRNLLDYGCNDSFRYFSEQVANTSYPYLLYEFKKEKPSFSYYMLQTHLDGGRSFPVSWEIEGTNDVNGEWEFLDKRENEESLSDFNKKKRFTMKANNYKYIMFTQTKNKCDRQNFNNTLAIRRIDFYFPFCSVQQFYRSAIRFHIFLGSLCMSR